MNPALAIHLTLWLLFGLVAGAGHFALLRWNAALYLTAGNLLRALAVQILRLAVTTALLAFAAFHGPLPLLLAAMGVLLGRPLVLQLLLAVPP